MSSSLKISIPIKIEKEGGVYTFLSNFIKYLDKKGFLYSSSFKIEGDEDVLFANSWVVPYHKIKKAKRRNKNLKVVHRIDGSAQDYGRTGNADKIQSRVNTLADITIFQSNYGKYATTQKYPVIKNDGPVIYNPVDIKAFRPDGERLNFPNSVNICCATFSTNKKKGLNTIYKLAEEYKGFDFFLCGRFDNAPALKNIHLMGMLDKGELARIMRSCDLFLFPSENEACPNVVLEAMASGLPIIYKNSGGTAEIVGGCGIPLGENFEADVRHIMSKRTVLSSETRDKAIKRFSPDTIFAIYIDAILKAERKPVKNFFNVNKLRLKWGKS